MNRNADIDANPFDEWIKWLDFPPQDERHGGSEMNAGGSGSRYQLKDACGFIPEMDRSCVPTNAAGKIDRPLQLEVLTLTSILGPCMDQK